MELRFASTLICIFLPGFAFAFSPHNQLSRQAPIQLNHRGWLALSSSRDEEIAKLEEQLRKLKEESDASEAVVEEPTTITEEEVAPALNSEDYVGRGPAKRPVQPMQEMMSEAWKVEDDNSASEGGGLSTILAAVAVVLFVGIFSQIPVGQEDLTKYQAVKTSTSIDLGDINPIKSGDF